MLNLVECAFNLATMRHVFLLTADQMCNAELGGLRFQPDKMRHRHEDPMIRWVGLMMN